MVLRDLLFKEMTLLICGTAAGKKSAETKLPYSLGGNSFYKTLSEVKLTDKLLSPKSYKSLRKYGIGLTDLAKNVSGVDKSVNLKDYNVRTFKRKVIKYSPKIVCFNGKKAAEIYFGLKTDSIHYGKQCHSEDNVIIYFVAPSTSGSARRYWDLNIWDDLAKLVDEVRIESRNNI